MQDKPEKDEKDLEKIFPGMDKRLKQEALSSVWDYKKYPEVYKLQQKHALVQDSAVETRSKEVAEQLNRDKGKLKLLASDTKRSSQVNSFKSAPFLESVLSDHKKVIKKNKDEVVRDIE